MSIKILKPGLFTTVQDIGRKGYMNVGFSEAGALDLNHYQIASHLIGNDGPALNLQLLAHRFSFYKRIHLPLQVVVSMRYSMVKLLNLKLYTV